jgi:hypothetical protein
MASTLPPAKRTLNLRRSCERSRLEAQILAASYELLTPFLRRALLLPQGDRQPTQPPRNTQQRHHRPAGGQQA